MNFFVITVNCCILLASSPAAGFFTVGCAEGSPIVSGVLGCLPKLRKWGVFFFFFFGVQDICPVVRRLMHILDGKLHQDSNVDPVNHGW